MSFTKTNRTFYRVSSMHHATISVLALLMIILPAGLSAAESHAYVFNPDYSLRLNDREAGFYYHERVVQTTEGPVLEISMELHDNTTRGRHGCEQTNRLIAQDLFASGLLGEEGFDDPLVDDITFYEHYKQAFLRHADNVRPYGDFQEFFSESLRIWYAQHCFLGNRLESNPEWFLDLPAEQLVLNDAGMPRRASFHFNILGFSEKSLMEIEYIENQLEYMITTEGYMDISATVPLSAPVFDPFQINMIVASIDFDERFDHSFRFKDLLVDSPPSWEVPEAGPATELSPVDVTIEKAGLAYLPLDGEERPVWVVDVSGFRVPYHPLLHLFDQRVQDRVNTMRYYICEAEGDILMMETLDRMDNPVSIFHAN